MAINFSGTDLGLPEFPLHREICWEHGVCPIGEMNYRWSKMSKNSQKISLKSSKGF